MKTGGAGGGSDPQWIALNEMTDIFLCRTLSNLHTKGARTGHFLGLADEDAGPRTLSRPEPAISGGARPSGPSSGVACTLHSQVAMSSVKELKWDDWKKHDGRRVRVGRIGGESDRPNYPMMIERIVLGKFAYRQWDDENGQISDRDNKWLTPAEREAYVDNSKHRMVDWRR